MSTNTLTSIFKKTSEYQDLIRKIDSNKRNVQVQIIDEAVPYLIASIREDVKTPMLIICHSPEQSRKIQERILAWSYPSFVPARFAETDSLPFERMVSNLDVAKERLEVLDTILNESVSSTIITSTLALSQKTLSKEIFIKSTQTIKKDADVSLDDITFEWQKIGYVFEPNVYNPGFASRRGGILDIFPMGSEHPFRIELWGDKIESIRKFDPATQRSLEEVDSFRIIPASETLPFYYSKETLSKLFSHIDVSNCDENEIQKINKEIDSFLDGLAVEDLNYYSGFFNHGCILDYFPTNGTIIELRPNQITTAAWDNEERIKQLKTNKESRGELPYNFPSNHLAWNEIEARLDKWERKIECKPWGITDLQESGINLLPFSSAPTFNGDLDSLVIESTEFARRNGRVVISSNNLERIGSFFKENKVAIEEPEADSVDPGNISILKPGIENIGQGFVLNSSGNRMLVLSDTELFGRTKQRRTPRKKSKQREAFFEEISPGDFVVHIEHGIAKFIGTGSANKGDNTSEYIILEYAHGDKLYVPMDHIDRVAPYMAPMDRNPSLTRLDTQEWNRTKQRVEKSTKEMAADLLSIYAAREVSKGYAMGPDTKWQMELENSFPYEETTDQLSTLSEIKQDMESTRPMDRLVCGDVGYGKTEIALRAAFKTAMEGKQVAILVPTTVLAQQHFDTFNHRMGTFPVRIEVLSRFKSTREQKQILTNLQKGAIDICIGTHRLVQKDVSFKDLGLVIVDEEQRFGVSHKERLKQMRSQVDVLTLTATPIPRTLHMSLAGVRDMSTIETAPEERIPIKTFVSEFSEDLIREAVIRELDRDGQVYFLHNRVYNIEYISQLIRNLVPEARVNIAHGQMSENELEKSMLSFSNGDTDVLVCTTIIESGLDIPNANTLIINRADSFGLSQLYQLRGRIGRSSKQAYSYLLIPSRQTMTETAEQRLKAMLSATELGSGFKIAMKDLEIRGAGNILGAEQSGHIYAVGFELYTRLLSSAVEDLRSKQAEGENYQADKEHNVHVDLRIPAGIPEEYISDLGSRLDMYQNLTRGKSCSELKTIEQELRDRYGPLPWQCRNLIYILSLKIIAATTGVEGVYKNNDNLILQFPYEVGSSKIALQRIIGTEWEIGHQQVRSTVVKLGNDWEKTLISTLEQIGEFQKSVLANMSPQS